MTAVPNDVGPPTAAPAPRPPTRHPTERLLLAAPVLWIAVMGWTHRWMTEDGFIYLRIVRNLRLGHGPVFNAGERVEAYTGTLWTGTVALLDLVTPLRLEWIAVLLGIAGTTLAVAVATRASRDLWAHHAAAPLLPLGSLVFVALFPVWAYASSGLENGLTFAWLALALAQLARWADGRPIRPVGAMVIGLGWLVRPEMVLYSAVFVLIVAVGERRRNGRRAAIRTVAAAVALPMAYQVFRMGYFGALVPNTALAKEGTELNLDRGARYLLDFVRPYWLVVPLAGLLVGAYLPLATASLRGRERRRLAVLGAVPACAAVNIAYVVLVGGDYHHSRMFLPPLFALCAPVAVVPLRRRHLAAVLVPIWAAIAVVGLRPEQHDGNPFANGFLAPSEFGKVTTEDYGWGPDDSLLAWFDGPAYYLETPIGLHIAPGVDVRPDLPLPWGSFWGVGIASYAPGADLHVLDQLGLADALASHLEPTPPLDPDVPRGPGHEKPLPAPWVAALVTPAGQRPNVDHFPSFGNPMIQPTTGAEFDEQVAWARAALRCTPVRDLLESTTDPLTVRRFVDNLVGAPRRTRLRIPPDPETAYRRMCGSDIPPEVRMLDR